MAENLTGYGEDDVNHLVSFIAGHPDPVVAGTPTAAVRAILDVLADRGRLLPEPVETLEGWGWRYTDGGPIVDVGPYQRRARTNQKCGGGEIFRREARTYPDGSVLTSPWVLVDPDGGRVVPVPAAPPVGV